MTNDYIVVRRDIYERYGFGCAYILQFLADRGGEFIGTKDNFVNSIEIFSKPSIRNYINTLIEVNAISVDHYYGFNKKFTLVDRGLKMKSVSVRECQRIIGANDNDKNIAKRLPKETERRVARINQLKKEKEKFA